MAIYVGDKRYAPYVGSTRRVIGGVKGSILPPGYTQLSEISVTSGNYYIDTGVITELSTNYRFVTKVKYFNVSGSARQLCGNEYQPFWGCDKGKFNYSGSITPSTPTKNTVIAVDTWYNIDVTMESKSNARHRLLLFTLGASGQNINPLSTYQSKMAFGDSCEIYEGNTLIRNLIPCTNPNNVEGMFDIIGEEFHPLISY